jgi:hypothetical protein
MITFLASPKPFIAITKEHQYRAVHSWLAADKDVEVILYGDSEGIDEAGLDLGVQVVKQIDCAPSGIPYFGSIVGHAAKYGKHDFQVYLNCDILLSGIYEAMNLIALSQFLLIGQRIDLGESAVVDFEEPDWRQCLIQLAIEGKARLHSPTGIDYFAFRRGMWQDLPSIIIGRGGYDNALLAYCMRNRIPIVDGTFAVTALHQFHDYGHMRGGVKVVMEGSDAMQNIRQGGVKRSAPLVSDAEYVIKNLQVIPWPCRGDLLRLMELKLRFEMGWLKLALALRLIWRGMNAVKLAIEKPLSIEDVLDAKNY